MDKFHPEKENGKPKNLHIHFPQRKGQWWHMPICTSNINVPFHFMHLICPYCCKVGPHPKIERFY
jgi:hypothetical protein